MTDRVFLSLTHIFAILSVKHSILLPEYTFSLIKFFIGQNLKINEDKNNADLFNEKFTQSTYSKLSPEELNERLVELSIGILRELSKPQRFEILIYLFEFIRFFETISEDSDSLVNVIADIKYISGFFKIEESEFDDCQTFIFGKLHKVKEKQNLLELGKSKILPSPIKYLNYPNLKVKIYFLYIKSVNLFLFFFRGKLEIKLNQKTIYPGNCYRFENGSSIAIEDLSPIHYNDVIQVFIHDSARKNISLVAKNITYIFPNGNIGLHNTDLQLESGTMLGIMGGSGTGKSTLLNVLNGNLKPHTGNIFINGFDVQDHNNELKKVIGFIPQDDSLVEELTVYQNLYYTAKLCFADFTEEQIDNAVIKTLKDFELFMIKDLKVGSVLQKFISGGQRKRLNVCLEIIRQPHVLMVDEPTSGLSSKDAEKIMQHLSNFASEGKIVIVNIHQPSSDIFKLLSRLLILDQGGYLIFEGNPKNALLYFAQQSGRIDTNTNECKVCGNITPEAIFDIIEDTIHDEEGNLTNIRRLSPLDWREKYNQYLSKETPANPGKTELPEHNFNIQSKFTQTLIYLKRNVHAKTKDLQYILISLLLTPTLAAILGYITKNVTKQNGITSYSFSSNENIPSYIFMSVIVALFVGMIISAEEIFKDRRLLKRESFLNLSKISHINSKLIYLFCLSAFQMFIYVLIGNSILEIKGMFLIYWFVLFSLAFASNIIGLFISSIFKSAVTIYIVIPFLLIPQILLSGVVIDFKKVHHTFASEKNTPLIGDMMISRWGYEALVVTQYMENEYQKNFFDKEMVNTNLNYLKNYLIPVIESQLDMYSLTPTDSTLQVIQNGFAKLSNDYLFTIPSTSKVRSIDNFVAESKGTLNNIDKLISEEIRMLRVEINNIHYTLVDSLTGKGLLQLKRNYHNNKLHDIVTQKSSLIKYSIVDNEIIRQYKPIHQYPEGHFGRSHLYAPGKRVDGFIVETKWFNIIAIWLMTLVVYLILISNFKSKSVEIFYKVKYFIKEKTISNIKL